MYRFAPATIAPSTWFVCRYLQATSIETRLPEHAVSIVILCVRKLLALLRAKSRTSVTLPCAFDIEEMTDSVTQNRSACTNGDALGPIFGVTHLHVKVIYMIVRLCRVKHRCWLVLPTAYEPTKQPKSAPLMSDSPIPEFSRAS